MSPHSVIPPYRLLKNLQKLRDNPHVFFTILHHNRFIVPVQGSEYDATAQFFPVSGLLREAFISLDGITATRFCIRNIPMLHHQRRLPRILGPQAGKLFLRGINFWAS